MSKSHPAGVSVLHKAVYKKNVAEWGCDTRRAAQIYYILADKGQSCSRLGDTSACLELREGNKPAVRLYSRAGFREVGRRRQYYDNGDAAILVSKQL